MSTKTRMTEPVPPHERRSVLQDWVHGLTFMQQSVLLTSVRGPDSVRKYHPAKALVKMLRKAILINAFERRIILDPYEKCKGSFTGALKSAEFPLLSCVLKAYQIHTDELPHHFQMHMLHASEILGYKHEDETTRAWWNQVYETFVADMHLFPETEDQMDKRLGDKLEEWLETAPIIEQEK